MPRLILFDVDQTLVDALEIHKIAYRKAFKKVFGVSADITEVKFAGKTVPNLIMELAELKGIPAKTAKSKLDEAIGELENSFIESMEDEEIKLMPGVKNLLENLRGKGRVLGIITGNPERMTQSILERAGIRSYFDIFVYGPEGASRAELVKIALEKARLKLGEKISGKDVAIVGDSIHDIESGKPYGAKTIAVITGFYSREEILKHSPDHIFRDLADPKILDVL